MSSKPQGQTVKTNCRNCVFAEYDGVTQTGCKAGRIDTFKKHGVVTEARDNSKEFFVVDRLCNFFRDHTWKRGGDDPLQRVQEEVRPSFAVMIYDLQKVEHNTVLDTLDKLIASSAVDIYRTRVVVSMYHYDAEDTTQVISKIDTLNAKGVSAKLVVNHLSLSREGVDFAAFKRVADCNYALRIDNDSNFNDSIFPEVNKSLNIDLERIVFFDVNGGMSVIPMGIVKQQYLNYKNYHNLEQDLKIAAIAQGSFKIIDG